MREADDLPTYYNTRKRLGFFAGPLAFLVLLALPAVEGLPVDAQKMAAIAVFMSIWWMCESVPIPVTSLLPIVLFPLLNITSSKVVAAHYASPIIFMFMGAFIIALAMQRWNLHRRIALLIVNLVGVSAERLVLGFMLATAVLSAFVSNTATAVMMMPVGLAIVAQVERGLSTSVSEHKSLHSFSINLMLGIAYAATIGGMATLIGTPPNAVLAGYMQSAYGYEISFFDWMKVGVPLAIIMTPLTWWWLTKVMNPVGQLNMERCQEVIDQEIREMANMSKGEAWTALVFACTSACWIFKGKLAEFFPNPAFLTDATIAIAGALALFLIPVDWRRGQFVMNWKWASKLPWDVLILFGGGLALAGGFSDSGLSQWIGSQAEILGRAPTLIFVAAVTLLIIFLTELTSNTATAAMIIPILAAIAIGLDQNPLLLTIPATLAASCAFMLPVATPPNAIIFGSGLVSIPEMSRSGFGLNLMSIVIVVGLTFSIGFSVFGIEAGVLPDWVSADIEPLSE